MKLVIDIPDKDYEFIKDAQVLISGRRSGKQIEYNIINAIKNGVSLPKGYGRLIDADAYRKDMFNSREFDFFKRLDMQPTIIEADMREADNVR